MAGVAALVLVLAGCAPSVSTSREAELQPVDQLDDWVIVSFLTDGDMDPMQTLLDTEVAAEEALQDEGVGYIDGNEAGADQYDLYFVGSDSEVMWEILEPILAEAPIAWGRVELRDGLEDTSPILISPEGR